MSSESIGVPAPNQANHSKSITLSDALKRAKDFGDAGERIQEHLEDYLFPASKRCASVSVLMCQLGGAAANASLCPSLYEFVCECIEAGFLPQLMHPEIQRRMGDREIADLETEFSLFNAFTFRLEPEDYKRWWNRTGDNGELLFSEIEKDHFDETRWGA